MSEFDHRPVLLAECLLWTPKRDGGRYLDCTFGCGGHSRALLENLDANSRIYALDCDPEAVARARALRAVEDRFQFMSRNFAEVKSACTDWGVLGRINSIFADLGVSSPQLDDARRGFSWRSDDRLDMRMDPRTRPDAAEWINRCGIEEMSRVFKELGQIPRAGALAKVITHYRRKTKITHTRQLANLIAATLLNPANKTHPATNAFRAIRMHINKELENLSSLLNSLIDILVVGGRLLLICFHSLEVRTVRAFLRPQIPAKLALIGKPDTPWKLLHRAFPNERETSANSRARSAQLLVIERCL